MHWRVSALALQARLLVPFKALLIVSAEHKTFPAIWASFRFNPAERQPMSPLLSKIILLAARALQQVLAQVRILLAEKYCEIPYDLDEFDVAAVSTMFLCNICRDKPKVPVITLCGHVYCWLCVKKWYGLKEKPGVCPVCRRHNEENELIPIHPRGVKMNYGNKRLLEDGAYKQIFGSYEGVMGDLVKKSCRGIRYFLSITKLQNVQIGVGWGLFGCLFLYYWVAVYR